MRRRLVSIRVLLPYISSYGHQNLVFFATTCENNFFFLVPVVKYKVILHGNQQLFLFLKTKSLLPVLTTPGKGNQTYLF